MTTTYRKKLIEVALPLKAINEASAREKSIRHGHPSTLHLWWARRPLAAARAVLFAQLVDDPSAWPELFPTEEAQERERQRLFHVIEELVPWEASNDERIINAARLEIARSWARSHSSAKAKRVLDKDVKPEDVNDYLATELPPVHDPFAGGGTIPLEAQRLGLRAIATDLNPVAVLINKALIEIPPKFAGRPPVNPESRRSAGLKTWKGAQGLAEDVRYYGAWMREEAKKRIGHLYPDVEITSLLKRGRPSCPA
jgi:putative DNA methylase